MCTATYLPNATGGFVLTHSRDEQAVRRPACPPQTDTFGGHTVLFPQDPQSSGTWIASSGQLTLCLLNGAVRAHQPQPPYRHSRGLVIPHFFSFVSVDAFVAEYDFSNIEPFTLLVCQTDRLAELRWNGNRTAVQELDPAQPHIWSSVTLYGPDVVARREGWFRQWLLQKPNPSVAEIRNFHQTAGADDPENGLRMNRDGKLLTLSLSSVVQPGNAADGYMLYEDFTQHTRYQTNLPHYATA